MAPRISVTESPAYGSSTIAPGVRTFGRTSMTPAATITR
jgi:hypothetical protein